MRTRLTFLIRDLGYGGAQRQLVALARGLDRSEFDVSVVHFYPGPLESELRSAGLVTRCAGKRHRWDLAGFMPRLVRNLRATRPHILHSYLAESNLLSVLLKPFLKDVRVVWGLRDSQTDAALWGVLGRLCFQLGRRLSHRADHLIANSRAGREYYGALGFPSDRISVVANGIDTLRFRPDPASGDQLRSQWNRAGDGLLIGLVGRLNPMKDHATFLRAAAQVSREPARVSFVCVGGGDAAYAAEMQELAATLGIADKVRWIAPQQDMSAAYNALDLLVSSSAFGEGFSNVVAEAMACGVPCVVTDVGDSAWIVGDTGCSVPPRQPEALAGAILRLLALDAPGRAELGRRARLRIETQFSLEQLVRRSSDILRNLAPATRSAPLQPCLEAGR